MVKIVSFVEGKDATIIEAAARALCLRSGGECYPACGTRKKCNGWAAYVDEAETVVAVIRETHKIKPKEKAIK